MASFHIYGKKVSNVRAVNESWWRIRQPGASHLAQNSTVLTPRTPDGFLTTVSSEPMFPNYWQANADGYGVRETLCYRSDRWRLPQVSSFFPTKEQSLEWPTAAKSATARNGVWPTSSQQSFQAPRIPIPTASHGECKQFAASESPFDDASRWLWSQAWQANKQSTHKSSGGHFVGEPLPSDWESKPVVLPDANSDCCCHQRAHSMDQSQADSSSSSRPLFGDDLFEEDSVHQFAGSASGSVPDFMVDFSADSSFDSILLCPSPAQSQETETLDDLQMAPPFEPASSSTQSTTTESSTVTRGPKLVYKSTSCAQLTNEGPLSSLSAVNVRVARKHSTAQANTSSQGGNTRQTYEGCSTFVYKRRDCQVQNRNRPFRCTFPGCFKAYLRRSHLVQHEHTHKKHKPFACYFQGCSMRFVRPDELKRHFRKHTGYRPYKCTCGKTFRRSDHLLYHRLRSRLCKPTDSFALLSR